MRKYGKYEKTPKAKSLMLQTYLTSLLCLVLCVTMFFGTTYAWFTSEVTNTANEIYIGILDVALDKKAGSEWLSLDSEQSSTKLFDRNIRWEPGYTTMETVRVVNKGDLAFNYNLNFTDGKLVDSNEDLYEVAKNFVIYVYRGTLTAENTPTSFAAIEASEQWKPVMHGDQVATLADVLKYDLNVFAGYMDKEVVKTYEANDPAAPTGPSPADINESEHTYTIAMHMLEVTSDDDIMGKKISLNVKLTAYQRAYEQDAFGTYYDSLEAFAQSLAEIKALEPKDITYIDLTSEDEETAELDAVYEFTPNISQLRQCAYPLQNFVADFVVTSDRDIEENTLLLAGYCSQIDDSWLGMTFDGKVAAGTPMRLVQNISPSIRISYDVLCELATNSQDNTILCGIRNLSSNNSGAKITVELRLYKLDQNGNPTTEYVVVSAQQFEIQ